MAIFATLNVGRNGISKSGAVKQLLDMCNATTCALQELDINRYSMCSWVADWRAKGFHALLSSPCFGFCRVGIVSTQPLKPIQLSEVDEPDRVVAAISEFELPDQQGVLKLIVCSVYCPVGDEDRAAKLALQVVTALAAWGFPFIVLGDFNTPQSSSGMIGILSRPGVFALDESFGPLPLLPPTRKDSTRRIDYGSGSGNLFPQRLMHFEGVADHRLVAYEFDDVNLLACPKPPKRLPLDLSRHCDDIAARFSEVWNENVFLQQLCQGEIDSALQELSNAAEFALQSVGSNPRACVARSQPWTPVKLRPLPKAAQQVEPILLSRARRLHRRFVQLQRDPGQVKLHRVCLRNLVSLADRIPEIRHWHHCDGPQLVQALSDACVRMESEHKRSRIQAWRDSIHGNLAKQVSWIKRRSQLLADIAEEPLGPQGSINAIHPATIVSQQEQTLGSLWTSVEPPNLPDLQRLLHQMGGHSAPVDLNLVWDAASLRKLAKSMCGKSAGIDGWSAEALVLLPEQWWTGFAALWNTIWCTGNVPSIWKYARVALVPKDAADWRPLAIASVLWRIGASFLVKGLRPWLSSVLDHRVSGGVPGRSVCHAVLRIVDAIHNDAQCIMVAQDLAEFFDSLQLEQVILIAMHFGAPPQLVPLLKSFYHNCWRLFTCRGVCSDSWRQATRGVLQGCPLSPALAALVMTIWSQFVCTPNIDAAIYVDDRTFWHVGESGPTRFYELQQAHNRSSQFDAIFAIRCRPSKCKLAYLSGAVGSRLAQAFGYSSSSTLKVLGTEIDFHTGDVTLSRLSVAAIKVSLQLLQFVAPTFRDRRRIIQSLVISKICWAAGLAAASTEQLLTLRKMVCQAFGGRVLLKDSAVSILLEVLPWNLDPVLASEWAALRAAFRYHCQKPAWVQMCRAAFVAKKWMDLFPRTFEAVRRLSWTVTLDGACIVRQDSLGIRRYFVLGVDNPRIIFDWLVDAHRTHALGSTRRVRESFHRHAEATAVGLDLPGVPHDARCLFSGHKTIFNAMGATPRQRQSALASGCSFWWVHGGQRVPDDDPRTECMCGLRYPSRPHLVWACDATADLRVGIAPPVNRVEERLFGKIIPEWPAPPPVVHGHHEAVEFFADCLHNVARGQRSVFYRSRRLQQTWCGNFCSSSPPSPGGYSG